MCTLRLATAVLLCAIGQHALAVDPPSTPTAAQLRESASGECADAGKHAGIDYARSLDRAIAKDPAGLATLFRFTDSGWFDGAAAEGHCAILFGFVAALGRPTILSCPTRAEKAGSRSSHRCYYRVREAYCSRSFMLQRHISINARRLTNRWSQRRAMLARVLRYQLSVVRKCTAAYLFLVRFACGRAMDKSL